MLSTKLKEAAGNGADATLYVDDVFSTYLYTGTGAAQTITNGIDLAGKGGMVWTKSRNGITYDTEKHIVTDTVRGATNYVLTNSTQAQSTFGTDGLRSFLSDGFTVNFANTQNYVSWTFREAAKFFDVVTYTGTGSARTIAHSLGVAPGMVIVKRTDTSSDWQVYSNGLTSAAYSMQLNLTEAQALTSTVWNSTAPTSSVFSVGTHSTVNASGGTYVAYLYAHDTSSTGIIQCGSFTTDASGNATVNLGWEPQYLLDKAKTAGGWNVYDIMRGWSYSGALALYPNSSFSEVADSPYYIPSATGFTVSGYVPNVTKIYLAIRRPNKPPTSGTQVFNAIARSGTGSNTTFNTNIVSDVVLIECRTGSFTGRNKFIPRLAGSANYLTSSEAGTEHTLGASFYGIGMQTYCGLGTDSETNSGSCTYINWAFKRAPGFFDVVCYTGTGSATTQAHNLGVAPEMMIIKSRSNTGSWWVYDNYLSSPTTKYLRLNEAIPAGAGGGDLWNSTAPTNSVFSVGIAETNYSGYTYVAYLFATLAGISKVGSYTGNGSSQNIECGFAAGARFVLIKRTDSTGDWFVWDTARGIVAANDPHLSLNTTAAEVTTDDSVDPYSAGFAVNQVAATNINVSSATYIFLAIA